jgi:hypothetical protein
LVLNSHVNDFTVIVDVLQDLVHLLPVILFAFHAASDFFDHLLRFLYRGTCIFIPPEALQLLGVQLFLEKVESTFTDLE